MNGHHIWVTSSTLWVHQGVYVRMELMERDCDFCEWGVIYAQAPPVLEGSTETSANPYRTARCGYCKGYGRIKLPGFYHLATHAIRQSLGSVTQPGILQP